MALSLEPPDGAALKLGLQGAIALYVDEADLSRAAGETGIVRCHVEVALDHGRVRWTKGSVAFERRIEIGGKS